MTDQAMTREELSARLDTFGHMEVRLDRYANQDSNSMPFLRKLQDERNAAKEVILTHFAALREELAQVKEERGMLMSAMDLYKQASFQSHSGHWDKTGGSGAGCPACIRANELCQQAQARIAELEGEP